MTSIEIDWHPSYRNLRKKAMIKEDGWTNIIHILSKDGRECIYSAMFFILSLRIVHAMIQ